MTRAIYMDYNATAPVRPEAAQAVADALAIGGNASSVHGVGRKARRCIEDARESVAALVGARPAWVVFTSGGTEANTLALYGSGRRRLLVSAVEHPSILNAAPDAERIPVTADGVVDLAALERMLAVSDVPALVSIMAANNETGALQPVSEAARLAHAGGALIHCDAVQAAGKVALDMTVLDVDLMSLSAHKIGGPQGVGALIVRDGVALAPLFRGGGQERSRRAGTENTPGIAGFGAAARWAAQEGVAGMTGIAALRDRLEARLAALAPRVEVFSRRVARLPNTSCFALPGLSAETQVMALDLAGIAVSSGSACSSGKVGASHVLKAMVVTDDLLGSALRVSLGWNNDAEDLTPLIEAWGALAARAGTGRIAAAA